MFDGGSATFSVVYSDGGREINVGTVAVDPSLNFKKLLSLLSEMIGISPHQFSVYLAALGSDRKIPITAKVNLAAMPRDDGAYFFFVKRSRRPKKVQSNGKDSHPNKKNPPENVMLLRRTNITEAPLSAFATAAPRPPPPILDRVEYERRMRNLRTERERFLMNMRVNDATVGREVWNGAGAGERNGGECGGPVCADCLRATLTGIDAGFHLCVYDEVTERFRSPAGPISRPARKPGDEEEEEIVYRKEGK